MKDNFEKKEIKSESEEELEKKAVNEGGKALLHLELHALWTHLIEVLAIVILALVLWGIVKKSDIGESIRVQTQTQQNLAEQNIASQKKFSEVYDKYMDYILQESAAINEEVARREAAFNAE